MPFFFSEIPDRCKEDLINEPHNTLGKLVEIILNNKVRGHMDKNEYRKVNMICLFVFKEKLCLMNLFNFSEKAINYVDMEYPFDMVYLHFQTASSNVLQPKTLKYTKKYGKVLGWIKNCLEDRKQSRRIKSQ